MLICVCGLPGSGKSFFEKHLAKHLNISRLNTDELREEMKQLGQYDETSRLAVYIEMAERAKPVLLDGKSLIFDASFNNKEQRKIILDLNKDCAVPLAFIRCFADEKTSLERVSKKRKFTEADTRVYYLLKDLWQELTIPHISLDSRQQPLEARLELAVSYIESLGYVKR